MKKTIVLLIVSFAMFMEAVDTTVINTAIPVMAKSLKVNPIDLKLALISYLLSLAIFIPISGWIADKFGIKKVFIFAVLVFTLSSLWCGFTNKLWELVLARIVQGIGGSLTMPIGRLIILRSFERHELIAKMSIVVMVASLGMMLGPLLGGVIVDHFSWHWIFWVNLPVGVLIVLMSMNLPADEPAVFVPPLDVIGFILFGSGLATLTYGLSMFSESDISLTESVLTLILSILLLIGYQRHSAYKQYPIVNVRLLSVPTFQVAVIGNLLARLGFGGMPFLLPLLLQIVLGFSPRLSGMLLAPVALGVFIVKPMSIYILRFLGYKTALILNTVLVGMSLWSFILINQKTSIYTIGVQTFCYGFLIAFQYTAMNSLAYANLNNNDISSATSIMSTIQQLAQSFGVAISAMMVGFFAYEFSSHQVLTTVIFHYTFFMLGLFTLLSGSIFFRMKKEDGQELIGNTL